jgi:hypothetical protein
MVLGDLRTFNMTTLTELIDGEASITRVSIEWELGITSGFEAGSESINAERSLSLAGATWVRRNDT